MSQKNLDLSALVANCDDFGFKGIGLVVSDGDPLTGTKLNGGGVVERAVAAACKAAQVGAKRAHCPTSLSSVARVVMTCETGPDLMDPALKLARLVGSHNHIVVAKVQERRSVLTAQDRRGYNLHEVER